MYHTSLFVHLPVGLFPGVAAAGHHDGPLRHAAARHDVAAAAQELAREEARVDLAAAAHTAPAHAVVVIVAALDGAQPALVVQKDAPHNLQSGRGGY